MRRTDLSGNKYNRLTVIDFAYSKSGNAYWNCKCICGGEATASTCHLKSGHTKSCGCLHSEVISKLSSTHRESVSTGNAREYRSWQNMKRRCYDKNNNRYYRYGGRGIYVCDHWINSYENFLSDMGRCPEKHTLDRINNDGIYEPTNCKWSSASEQAKNRSTSKEKP